MKVKSNYLLIIFSILLILSCVLLCFLSYSFFFIYVPAFKAMVVDKVTGVPLENVEVRYTLEILPLPQILNVGGANYYREDSKQIIKTNENGYFKTKSYFKFYLGWFSEWHVRLKKEGYVPAYYYRKKRGNQLVLDGGYYSMHRGYAVFSFDKQQQLYTLKMMKDYEEKEEDFQIEPDYPIKFKLEEVKK